MANCACVVATLVVAALLIVLVFAKNRGGTRGGRRSRTPPETFLDEFRYRPCSLSFDRTGCKGFTSGMPASIDTDAEGDFSCCGYIGVPP
jgi:hypothetical protein